MYAYISPPPAPPTRDGSEGKNESEIKVGMKDELMWAELLIYSFR